MYNFNLDKITHDACHQVLSDRNHLSSTFERQPLAISLNKVHVSNVTLNGVCATDLGLCCIILFPAIQDVGIEAYCASIIVY